MSMERAFMREVGPGNYRSNRINMILTRLGQGNIKQGVMILSYAGIPIYLVSDYDMDQIYFTIIDSKCRNGESKTEISLWLASQPMEPELRKEINHHLDKIA
ncbi:MAG: hypothetical protein IKQ97_07580 [Eubacterium sp.]|nr:hypothetical protein [Eubacterium sp.]